VLLDDEPINACLVLGLYADGRHVTTARGLGIDVEASRIGMPLGGKEGSLLGEAFVANGAVQCGFCIPGMLVTAAHLLRTNPNPSREQIRSALAANLCRCTGYQKIVEAVAAAAARLADR
jgi:carbon-monoxide dehydrogenase small subunit